MKILLIEDDDRIARPLAKDLRHQHHTIDVAKDGQEGWNFATATEYDLILLDIMLPHIDGITLCQRLRTNGCKSLILMLTARDTTSDKIIGLDAGADDYLVKPFALEELAAHIRALARRTAELKPAIIHHGLLQLNLNTSLVLYHDQPLTLTPKEYGILECLLRQPTQTFTRTDLLNKIWDFDQTAGEETIKTHINNLRRKLKAVGADHDLIETVYGMGYRLAQGSK
jgi:two-component system, OmpR family, response regulator QseB